MTVAKVTIKPHEKLKNWYIVTFFIRNAVVGETSVSMVFSDEMLRNLFTKLRDELGEKTDYSNYPENIQKFMNDKDK